MSYRTYVRYLYVILSEIPHIKFGMTHPVTADVPSAVIEYQGLRPERINTFIRGL